MRPDLLFATKLAASIWSLGCFGTAALTAANESEELPSLPSPLGLPAPAAQTSAPYAPQPILAGGVVVPLYPSGSPHLNAAKVREPEVYHFWGPVVLGAITGIHNPSIEFHPAIGELNTGAAIILIAGGGHRSLNVGSEAAPLVPFFANFGVSTIILRNRLRSDGYDPHVDAANDTLQAIKLVRAYARPWKLDPNKIGLLGFSAGGELAAIAATEWENYDRKEDIPGNFLAKISSRPDFAALIYPGPSPFAGGARPSIPRASPPVFILTAGWGDWAHAYWASEYFDALLRDDVPNVELHIYARGHHPGDKVGADEPPATGGLASKGGIAFETWADRFLDWIRDLGFLGKSGERTLAAKDVDAHLDRVPPPPPKP